MPSGITPIFSSTESDLYRRVIERCKPFRCEIFLDARGESLQAALPVGGFFLKHNRDEARTAVFFERLTDAGIHGALITDGPREALVWSPPEITILKPPSIREVSAVGSGDAAMAGLLWGHANGLSRLESAQWTMAAGAADALHPGPCQAGFQEIEERLSEVAVIARKNLR